MKKSVLLFVVMILTLSVNKTFAQDFVDTLNAARRASNNGEYRKALKYYKSAETINPKEVDLSLEMGQTAYKAGDYETAKRCFDNLAGNAKTEKKRSTYHTDSGISSLGSEDYKGAEEEFKKALRENPGNEKARQLLMEAKRKRKQKEQEEGQDQNEGDKNKDQNKGGQQNNKSNNGNKPSDGNGKKKPGDQQGNQNGEGNLEDKQTERRLDELMKEEADARRRMNGNNGTTQNNSAEKDW